MTSTVRAEINVTPLVDVCLVLLIIFMFVTPLVSAVRLPEAPEPEPWGTKPARSKIVVSFGPSVTVRVDDDPNPLNDAALSILLRAMHEADPLREIALRADRRLPYAEVRRVLRVIQEARFPAVGLVAERTAAKR